MNNIKAVLFDLDGTLVDTAPDMANALNTLLQQLGKRTLPFSEIRNYVSKGGSALIRFGLGEIQDSSKPHKYIQNFLDVYSRSLCVDSKLFDGFEELLRELEQSGIIWGIVTNKPGFLTTPLLQQLQLLERAACVISGDTLVEKKPHPAPLLLACEKIGCRAEQAVYIGDDQRDITAGNAAGMATLIARYGYINDDEKIENWGADGMIASASELRDWLASARETQSL